MDGKKNVVQVVDFSIDRFDGSGSIMDSKDSFENTMFEKKLPMYKD